MDIFTTLMSAAAQPSAQKTAGGFKAILEGGGDKLALMGMVVVFSGLVVLTLVLYGLPGFIRGSRNLIDSVFSPGKVIQETTQNEEQPQMTGEEAAAISMAIILYHRMHMAERRQKLTMRSELKMLSPWALAGKIQRTGRTLK